MGPAASLETSRAAKPNVRRKMLFWDRVKVLFWIVLILAFLTAKYHAEIPIISWGEALGNQVAAKSWLLVLGGIEIVRQLHYVVCERSAEWNHFWSYRIFGGWDRFWGRRNPWLRFRMARLFKGFAWTLISLVVLAAIWKKDIFEAAVEAPLRIYNILLGQEQSLPFIFQIAMMLLFAIGQFAAIFWFMSRGGVETYQPDEIDTRFTDVWGQDRIVEKVTENIVFLEKPEEIESRGGHVPSGILLWGPPGTGKTLIAKAVAGETGRPYVFVDPGAFQNMFFGVGILKVKSLFRKLRKLALRHGGVIVFFDEADSLGNRGLAVAGGSNGFEAPHYGCNGHSYLSNQTRSLIQQPALGNTQGQLDEDALNVRKRITNIVATGMGGGGGGMGTLQALLTEISGLEKPRGWLARRMRTFLTMPAKKPPKYRILIMMATNAPSALDEALLRPGRLDRQYKVDYPTLAGRRRTFEGYLGKVSHELTQEQIDRLALMSPNATGATIKDVVNESLIVAMRAGRSVITWPDVLTAKGLKAHGMPDPVHPISLERHAVALHEAGHAMAMFRLRKKWTIDVATIEPRGAVGGFVSPIPTEEPGFPWRQAMETDVMVSLASLATERHFYAGDNSVGVGGDMHNATAVVRSMVGRAAMGSSLTSYRESDVGEQTKSEFDRRVEERLEELYAQTVTLVATNQRQIMAIAHALELYHTISGEDIDAIFSGGKGPIVDGSWYQTPEFEYVYTRYHADALRAHRDQSDFTTTLPTQGSIVFVPVQDKPLSIDGPTLDVPSWEEIARPESPAGE